MLIGQRLRELREFKKLSQVEVSERSGFQTAYISRVENGHTSPGIESLERWAKALEIPVYQIFHGSEVPPEPRRIERDFWGNAGAEAAQLSRLRAFLSKMPQKYRNALLALASHITASKWKKS